MASYYDETFEPWVRGIQGLGSMIMQGPALRAQAAERAQRGRLVEAQIAGQQVTADRGRAQIAELLQKGRLVKAIEEATPQAQADMVAGETDTPAIRQVLGSTAALTGQKSGDIATNFRRFQSMLLARSGQVDDAAGVENPVSVANTAANNKSRESIADAANKSREKIAGDRPTVLSPGAAVMNPDGTVKYRNPSAAGQREGEWTWDDKEELRRLNAELAKIETAQREMPDGSNNPHQRTLNAQRKQVEAARAALVGKYKGSTGGERKIGEAATPGAKPGTPGTPAASGAAPAAAAAPAKPRGPINAQAAVEEANRAIARGADPKAVQQRLKELGINVEFK